MNFPKSIPRKRADEDSYWRSVVNCEVESGLTKILHSNGTTELFDENGTYLSSRKRESFDFLKVFQRIASPPRHRRSSAVDILAEAVESDLRSAYLMEEFAKRAGFRLFKRQAQKQKLSDREYSDKYNESLISFLRWFLRSSSDVYYR